MTTPLQMIHVSDRLKTPEGSRWDSYFWSFGGNGAASV